MKKLYTIDHRFLEYFPEKLENGIIYISMEHGTAVHNCMCGCGNPVYTPFGPTDWQISYDGVSVSLDPSIGNWSYPCQSHYWIKNGKVKWTRRWSKEEIEQGRMHDLYTKKAYFSKINEPVPERKMEVSNKYSRANFWSRLKEWIK